MVRVGLHNDPEYKVYGLLATITFHGLLILFLIMRYIVTPIPPYPEGGGGPGMGVEVNLGYDDEGFGAIQEEELAVPDFKETKTEEAVTEENIVTQDVETDNNINLPPKQDDKPKDIKQQNQQQTVQQQQQVNPLALFKKNNTTNQGVNGGTGDQGNPNGTTTSNNYFGNGTGSGGGTGGGTGTGTGNGTGSGISWSLNGRSIISTPEPRKDYTEEGRVVVEITVNRDGIVTEALPGVKGSTTTNTKLLNLAREAAMKVRVRAKTDAPIFQKGTITYDFRVRE